MIHEAHSASRSPRVQPGVIVQGKGESPDCYARGACWADIARVRFGGRGAMTGCGRIQPDRRPVPVRPFLAGRGTGISRLGVRSSLGHYT